MSSRILLTGASGQVGGYLLRELSRKQVSVVAWSGTRTGSLFGFDWTPVDLADRDQLAVAFDRARPSLVIHTAAVSRVDQCYRDPQGARLVNGRATAMLVELCERAGARLVHVSTDLVFDGAEGWYREDHAPAPVSVYGETKACAERAVLAYGGAAVVRVSLLTGPTLVSRPSFFERQLDAIRSRQACTLFADEWRTPLSLLTAAGSLLAIAESDYRGLLHLGGPERMTRWEMGRRLAMALGADPSVFVSAERAELPSPEPRPRDVSLDSTRFRERFPNQPWPPWEQAIAELGLS